jgi:Skp family chaperone for outer membrane proteins
MNNVMKIKLLLPLLCLFTLTGFSQTHQEKRDQIKALKVSYITTELNLTTAESEKFWPVYNAYEEKIYAIRHDRLRPLFKQLKDGALDKMSEKEARVYLDKFQAADEEQFNLRRKMVNDLRPVIGSVKMIKLKKVEDDFNKKLLDKYKDKDKKD